MKWAKWVQGKDQTWSLRPPNLSALLLSLQLPLHKLMLSKSPGSKYWDHLGKVEFVIKAYSECCLLLKGMSLSGEDKDVGKP